MMLICFLSFLVFTYMKYMIRFQLLKKYFNEEDCKKYYFAIFQYKEELNNLKNESRFSILILNLSLGVFLFFSTVTLVFAVLSIFQLIV